MAEKHAKAVKRYGVRYGRTIRKRVANIEAQQRAKHKCPHCSYQQVRRVSAGIWQCKKCKAKFASRAYTVAKVAPPKEQELHEV